MGKHTTYRQGKIIDTRVGRLTVIQDRSERRGARFSRVLDLKCFCGKTFTSLKTSIKSGATKSCGCYHIYKSTSRIVSMNTKHGMTGSSEYNIWSSMKARCYNTSNISYKNYGHRGIKVCEAWKDDFSKFIRDVGPRPSKRHSLDRVDNNGDYSPTNCVWSLPEVQQNNKSNNRIINYDGRSMTLAQWSRELCVGHTTLDNRLKKWGTKKALTKAAPIKLQKTMLEYSGLSKPLSEWARLHKLSTNCVKYRLSIGMTVDEALTKPSIRPH